MARKALPLRSARYSFPQTQQWLNLSDQSGGEQTECILAFRTLERRLARFFSYSQRLSSLVLIRCYSSPTLLLTFAAIRWTTPMKMPSFVNSAAVVSIGRGPSLGLTPRCSHRARAYG